MPESRRYEETVQRGAEEVARLVGGGSRYANRAEVRKMAKRWTAAQKGCRRARKHSYTVTKNAYEVRTPQYRYFYEAMACSNDCGVWIEREMNADGFVFWVSHPHYPPGYLSEYGKVEGEARWELNLIQYKEAHPNLTVIRKASEEYEPDWRYEHGA